MAQTADKILTERLFLCGIEETDAAQIVKWRSDPAVYRFFKSPHQITMEEHLHWYRNSYLLNPNRLDWMCLEKETQTAVGVFGVSRDGEQAEVSYLLAPEAQHKGYAAEAVQGLVRFAFEKWHCRRVVAEIHKNNEASIRMIKKLGFKQIIENDPFFVYAIEVQT